MALFSMRMQVIKRSAGRSVIAAAAYRSAEKIHDDRQGIVHDYSRRKDVERTELLFPADAPAWVTAISREALWNKVDASEKRKDAQTCRELRLMIPRELSPADRITIVRDYVNRCFVSRGMVADVCWHNKLASDGQAQPHAHVMLTMRPLTTDGFGPKSRHDWVPDPSGRTHPDGRAVMIESNASSWNSSTYYEGTREEWEKMANAALARMGSSERIDRRSLLERGLARLPEPALRLAFHLKELRGVMRERFGQFQMARHWRAVETRANAAFRIDTDPVAELTARAAARAEAPRQAEHPPSLFGRVSAWIDRQLARLPVATQERDAPHDLAPQERPRATAKPSHDLGMEH